MNRNLIEAFIQDQQAKGIGRSRLQKYSHILRKIDDLLGKDFEKADIEDIKQLVLKINESDYADWTKYDFKTILKIFWRWLKNDENPEEIKWIKPRVKNRNKLPEELLTQEDIKSLINATSNIKYKLLLSLLYESGARIAEILGLRMKNISFEKDKPLAKIVVKGKTGMRRIPLYAALPHLRKYINEAHADKDNPEAFLFYANKSTTKRIVYNSIRIRLRQIRVKAKINKAVNPHIFRHSRASYLANFLTDAQMKQYFGWTQSSSMCQVYIHMSGRDIDSAILSKVYGLKDIKEEVEQDKTIKPKVCLNCGHENSAEYRFCEKCNLALDLGTALQEDEEDRKAEEEIKGVFKFALKNPKMSFIEIMDKFREKV